MEGIDRTPFQGVLNIIRFNWHYYLISFAVIILLFVLRRYFFSEVALFSSIVMIMIAAVNIISLSVSCYIYDCSDLYSLNWLNDLKIKNGDRVVNINAGFDETSRILFNRYPGIDLIVLDFYDRKKHTEISIERARRRYPAFPGTRQINTDSISLQPNSADFIFLILSAHEIRNNQERIFFFRQLREALRADGKLIVVEHRRDLNNFLAYNVGFFHFFPRRTWKANFKKSALFLVNETNLTPFISVFFLTKYGITS